MPVIVRDAVASDHLVYAWPFPIGPEEYEVACADDEEAVMCPAWMVGERLGPGRHRWRTPDPTRPVSAFFVLTAPVEVSFDMQTTFMIPATAQPVRLRASGSLQVRCGDPTLLIAQFVGLPFDHVNEGVMRSVSRSVERMLGKLLARRVVMAGMPQAVTEAAMLPNILEELVAYNPTAGAVFGIELMRMGHLTIYADDGSQPWHLIDIGKALGPNGETERVVPPHGRARGMAPELLETVRAPRHPNAPTAPPPLAPPSTPPVAPPRHSSAPPVAPPRHSSAPPAPNGPAQAGPPRRESNPNLEVSGEIVARRARSPSPQPDPHRVIPTPPPPRRASVIEAPQSPDEITEPGQDMARASVTAIDAPPRGDIDTDQEPPRGSILGIGTSQIGHAPAKNVASGEIPTKIAPGARVLVPGPDGLMQSATVRQLLQGYYELEVGGSGDTIWVPMNGVVPE